MSLPALRASPLLILCLRQVDWTGENAAEMDCAETSVFEGGTVVFSCELGKGSYLTMALREIHKESDSSD